MKPLKFIFSLVFTSIPFINFAQQAVKFEKTYTEVCFSNNLNIQDLASAQKELQDKRIYLVYDNLKFGNDGNLTALQYHVTTGKVSAADKSFEKDFEIGFIVNTAPLKKYDIIAGTKQQIENKRIELEKKK